MRRLLILMLALGLVPCALADTVVSNSASWEDVYSGGIYAGINRMPHKFLVSLGHGEVLKSEIASGAKVLVIESDTVPYIRSYAARLEADGYTTEVFRTPHGHANLDLARRIKTSKYYIVDPTFGYDAISVAPLAIHEKAYVLFATKENIAEVAEFLRFSNPQKIVLVGELDPEVDEILAPFNPEYIKMGSRYKNNVELADRFRKVANSQQAVLTNGEFLVEDVFISGQTAQPILYIGRHRPPEETMNYLKKAGLKTTVLVGNDLVSSAKRIKDLLQIPMFVKFGKGMTEEGGIMKAIQGLDIFEVPALDLLLTLEGIGYNTQTGEVEVYIKNERPTRTYLLNSIAIKSNGQLVASLGDNAPQRLSENEERAFTYAANIGQYLGTNLTAEIVSPYGYTADEMDEAIEETMPLMAIAAEDNCELDITNAMYNPDTQGFEVAVKTNGECFARASIRNLRINDELTNPQSEITAADGTQVIRVKQPMTEVDIADNPEITVQVKYGSRTVLTKTKERTFKLKLGSVGDDPYAIFKTPAGMLMVGVIILLLILLLWKRKR